MKNYGLQKYIFPTDILPAEELEFQIFQIGTLEVMHSFHHHDKNS
jgi:hypothetical protein